MSRLHSARKAMVACAGSLLLPALASSQGTPTGLIGGGTNGSIGWIQQQQWCFPASRLCIALGGPPLTPFAGGTAYDGRRQILWDTDGGKLIGVRVTSVPSPCRVVCPSMPVPGMTAAAVATALGHDDTFDQLYIATSAPEIIICFFPATTACPAVRLICPLTGVIPPTHVPGGLAISERYKAVIYAASDFSAAVPSNIIYVAPLGNACQPFCKLTTGNCPGLAPLGAITGLAYDDCDEWLYATDGRQVQRYKMRPTTSCTPIGIDCCFQPLPGSYYGLEFESSHPRNQGSSCLTPSCAICPSMVLDGLGDPDIGNSTFNLALSNGPAGGIAFFYLGFGTCTPGIPFSCGLFHPALAPLLLGSAGIAGAGCSGSANFPLAIPNNYVLCGANVCIQCLVLCLGSPLGVGLTNAVNLTLTDN